MNTTLTPTLIIKYIFNSSPLTINLYTNVYNLIQFYNSDQFIEYIKLYYDITIPENNNFLYFILYSQFFKYKRPTNNILNILTSKIDTTNNNVNLINIDTIYKYTYCYTLKHVNVTSFINLRDKLNTGCVVYFALLYNKLSYLKDILTTEHIDKLVNFNSIIDIDNYIVQLVFNKKKCLLITTDSKLISILMGVSNKIIVKYCTNLIISCNEEFIQIRDNILTENIESTEIIYSEQEINIILQNFNIDNPDKLFLHILNLYFNKFFISFITKPIIDKIIYNIESIFNKNDRHSITLRKFKNYFIDPSFNE